MKTLFHIFNKKYEGFTLVELLIVIAIIGVLAAIIVPNVTGLVGSGDPEAARAELVTIQTAMDTMTIKAGLTSVQAVTTATSNMAAFPDATHPLYPNYLRSANTKWTYSCTSSGLVSQGSSTTTPTVSPTSTITKTPITTTPISTYSPAPTSTKTTTPKPPPVSPYQ